MTLTVDQEDAVTELVNIAFSRTAAALAELKQEGRCPEETLHRQVTYLNNVIEADHGKLKQLIRPVRGFKTLKTAYATIRGFEVMRALRKGQASAFNITHDIRGEARIVAASRSRARIAGPSDRSNKHGNTIDFYLSPTRSTAAAKRFLGKALNA